MEKYIGTYHKSSPFIQNLLKKQICCFEILWQNYPPPPLQIFSNLQLANCSNHADLMKSACRITPPTHPLLQILSNLLLTADFLKSACRIPPKISSNLLLSADLLKSADLVDFPKSSNGQLPTCACRNFPPICRFSQICHWIVTYMCLFCPYLGYLFCNFIIV